jgi:hypothetical protein
MQPRLLASSSAAAAMAPGVGGVEPVVTLDQVPRWSDLDQRLFPAAAEEEVGSEPPPYLSFSDPLTGDVAGGAAVTRASPSTRRSTPGSTSGAANPGTSRSTPSSTPPTRSVASLSRNWVQFWC